MILIDWIIVGIVGYNMVVGMFRGFIRILFDLVALAMSIYVAHQYHEPMAQWVAGFLPMAPMALNITSVVLLWGAVYLAVVGLGMGISKVASLATMGPLNAIAGLILGALRGALVSAPVVMIWQFIDPVIMHTSLILNFIFRSGGI